MSDQLDTTICPCLGAHEVLRRLNVPADSIRFVSSIEDDGRVGLTSYGAIPPVLACELPIEERAAQRAVKL